MDTIWEKEVSCYKTLKFVEKTGFSSIKNISACYWIKKTCGGILAHYLWVT